MWAMGGLPVVDKSHGPGGGHRCGSQTSASASVHDTQPAGSTVVKLVVVQSQGESAASGPGQVVGVGEIAAEAAGALIILTRSIECGLQREHALSSSM